MVLSVADCLFLSIYYKSFGDAFFKMKFISIHDDEVQP